MKNINIQVWDHTRVTEVYFLLNSSHKQTCDRRIEPQHKRVRKLFTSTIMILQLLKSGTDTVDDIAAKFPPKHSTKRSRAFLCELIPMIDTLFTCNPLEPRKGIDHLSALSLSRHFFPLVCYFIQPPAKNMHSQTINLTMTRCESTETFAQGGGLSISRTHP